MWNEPSSQQLSQMPELYATEHLDWTEKIIHEHFFLGGSDWFMAEFGSRERLFFGFAILNRDLQNAEWGYVALDELRGVAQLLPRGAIEVDRDLHWMTRRADEVEVIRKAVTRS